MTLPDHLRPSFGESFQSYQDRVGNPYPSMPEEILETWLFEHFDDVSRKWAWIGIEALTFVDRLWSTQRILKEVTAWNEPMIKNEVNKILSHPHYRRSGPVAYMIAEGTWSVAPLVLVGDGTLSTPDGELVPDYWLIEGHHRLGALSALSGHSEFELEPEHRLWFAQLA